MNGEAQPNNSTRKLKHGDRIVVGNHHFFRLNIPTSNTQKKAPDDFGGPIKDYAFAREELERIQVRPSAVLLDVIEMMASPIVFFVTGRKN